MIHRLKHSAEHHLRGLAKPYVKRVLRVGPEEPAYPRLQWLKARVQAVTGLQPRLYAGYVVEWDDPMHAWCVPFDLCGPRRGEVLVRTIASALSTGTEVAVLSLSPNTEPSFPTRAGYSAVGQIVAVGRGVRHLTVGQLVAGSASHASVVRLPARVAFPVPDGVAPEEAAFIQLGIITLHGVWRAGFHQGDRVAVLGRGVVGQLTVQIARALGAGECISIAPTPARITPALRQYADHILATHEVKDAETLLRDVRADVTFEVSGNPAALHDAVKTTRDDGRVVLLGSSRGTTRDFDFGQLAERSITLVGANIRTLSDTDYRRAGELFLRLIAERKINVGGLVTCEVNPWEAGWFYRHLSQGTLACAGAVFRWDRLADGDRLRPTRLWRPPDMEAIRAKALQQDLVCSDFSALEEASA